MQFAAKHSSAMNIHLWRCYRDDTNSCISRNSLFQVQMYSNFK